jgi:glycine cleavage system H protein
MVRSVEHRAHLGAKVGTHGVDNTVVVGCSAARERRNLSRVTVPDELRYSRDHSWVLLSGESVRVGLTHQGQDALGDVVHVALPPVGQPVSAGAAVGELESSKSVSEVSSPVSGTVVLINEALQAEPGLVNRDPYGAGWLYEVQLSYDELLESLLDAAAYRALVG